MAFEEILKLNITGNVIPMAWYQSIRRKDRHPCGSDEGKPYLAAIILLSDIVYWYRPREVRDAVSGMVVGYQKKFKGDLLQKSYQSYADQFGFSKREVQAAITFLEELGVITKVFRTIFSGGATMSNVLFLDLNVGRLEELTYPEEPKIIENVTEDTEEMEDAGGVTPTCNTYHTEREVSHASVRGITPTCNTSYSQEGDVYRDYNRDYNRDYPSLPLSCFNSHSCERARGRPDFDFQYLTSLIDKQLIQEILLVIQELFDAPDMEIYNIKNRMIPASEIKKRFSELTEEHLIYVAESYCKLTKKIKKPREYLISCLYNAPATLELATRNQVSADLGY